ncbi:MAG: diguanylate cyclase [Candidatus Brocadiia bacterium]
MAEEKQQTKQPDVQPPAEPAGSLPPAPEQPQVAPVVVEEDKHPTVEDNARLIAEISHENSESASFIVRYRHFIIKNTLKGLALGFICSSYVFGREYFYWVYQIVAMLFQGLIDTDEFKTFISSPPPPVTMWNNLNDTSLLFIGILIMISCVVFGLWDGWREDRLREYALKDRRRAEKITVISEKLAMINRNLERLTVTDDLTGLFNRRYAHQMLSYELSRSQRYALPLSVVIVDIDHFKAVNDTYGHLEGDRVLQQVSRLLGDSLRQTDVICRYGGEEFLLILPQVTPDQAKLPCKRILAGIAQHNFKIGSENVAITVSLGLAGNDQQFAIDYLELIRHADMALYSAKKSGRNRLCVFSTESQHEFIEVYSFQPEARLEELTVKILDLRSTMRESSISTIQSLINVVGTKNTNLLDHMREVAYHARYIARSAGMSHEEVETVFRAALLHDIGQLGIPDSVILKAEPLEKREWRIIEQHTEMGARILAPLGFLRQEVVLIKAHHERYDGLGYPEGTKGESIPLGAGIIAIADAYCFMISRHPYREPFTPAKAIEEIRSLSGKQFHPTAVKAFLDYIENPKKFQ